MKPQTFVVLLAAGTLYAQSPDPVTASGDTTSTQPPPAAIIGPLADGTQPAAVPPPPAPERQVLKSLTKRIVREEPAPLPDMRPVRKTVALTKQLIVSPPLPEAPAPPPADLTDPEVAARMAAFRASKRKTEIVLVSATVYDHRQTYLRWWPNGRPEREMGAWVDFDASLLTGFANYSWGERRFALIMGLGNEDTARRQRFEAMRGRTYTPPAIPEIPAGGSGFVVAKGDADAPGALDLVNSLVDLYRAEQPRLAAAYAGREKARLEREAHLRAHEACPPSVPLPS